MLDLLIDALPLVICAGSLGYMAGHVLCDRQSRHHQPLLDEGQPGSELAFAPATLPFDLPTDDERGQPLLLREDTIHTAAAPSSTHQPRR